MKKRVVLRADAGKSTGYGHFIRSLALAGYLKDDFECHFCTYNKDNSNGTPSDYQLEVIIATCNPIPVIGNTIEEYDEDFLNEIRPSDIVVLDNYYFTTKYQQTIKDKGCKLVCIDDMHDRHMVCDLLITPSPLKRGDFNMESYTQFVGGIEWAFLREPFLQPNKIRDVRTKIKRVVLAMGGADPLNLTDKMIRITHEVLPDAEINVMVGDTVHITPESQKIAKIRHRLNASQIVDLFDKSDLGIFPASTVCIEAISRKLPVAAGYFVNNQEDFYRYSIQHNLFSPLGCLNDDSEDIIRRLRSAVDVNRPYPIIIDFKSRKQKIIDLFRNL